MKCRFCGSTRLRPFLDLVASPPSNAYLTAEMRNKPEIYFPLKLHVCEECRLVQIEEYEARERLFSSQYAYFSSYSTTWLAHCQRYVEEVSAEFGLGSSSRVVEVASNDGYLLQFFQKRGIPVLGVEPTGSTVAIARERGIETIQEFFSESLAHDLVWERGEADLVIGNNVLAHVPDINDFVAGLALLLKNEGVLTLEFPHLLHLIGQCQFDTVYHEHFSYLSLHFCMRLFKSHGLSIFRVRELRTHGGSLRLYVAHPGVRATEDSVRTVLEAERQSGLLGDEPYATFQRRVDTLKNDFLRFLLGANAEGKTVAAYGAAAKGNTLLNYCGVKTDLIEYVVDRSPHKQGLYLPGSHIPIVDETRIRETRPEYVVILAWNLGDEIKKQLEYVREWNAAFVTVVPTLTIE